MFIKTLHTTRYIALTYSRDEVDILSMLRMDNTFAPARAIKKAAVLICRRRIKAIPRKLKV